MSALRERTDMTRDARSAHDPKRFLARPQREEWAAIWPPTQVQSSVRLYAPAPTRASLPEISWPRYQGRLFPGAYKQGAGQFAVFTDERCVVGLVVFTKNGRWPGVGLFFDQGFVSRAIWLKFCTYGGLSIVHQSCFRSNKILTVIRQDTRIEFGLRQ